MKGWRTTLIAPSATIARAIEIIDASAYHICLIVDGNERLLGTVTDGDVRRGILRAVALSSPVTAVMKPDPLSGRLGDGRERLLDIMHSRDVRQLPILDGRARVVDLVLRDALLAPPPVDNWVVLMAGGLGTRLRPMTEALPKPLLRVGRKPLLETILESFVAYNFRRFYISVHYKADMVKRHFGDGGQWDVEIRYLEEDETLGTAGALGLIAEPPAEPVIVMNGDLLTKVNFASLLDFHREQQAEATMCIREYDFQVPFGVVSIKDHRIVGIEEKPVQSFFVNAGIYVLAPHLLALARGGGRLEMTDLFRRIVEAGHQTAVFPVREYWLDVGRLDDFERANGDFAGLFGKDGA